jgi:hypothetical protein
VLFYDLSLAGWRNKYKRTGGLIRPFVSPPLRLRLYCERVIFFVKKSLAYCGCLTEEKKFELLEFKTLGLFIPWGMVSMAPLKLNLRTFKDIGDILLCLSSPLMIIFVARLPLKIFFLRGVGVFN